MLSRRSVLASAMALAACQPQSHVTGRPQKLIAVTMDDFNLSFDIKLSPAARNDAILAAFDAHNHKAGGFITGRFVDAPEGKSVVQSWSDAGHLVGNHSWTHLNSSDEDAKLIEADILKNDAALSGFSAYEKIFRFPFLAEGGTEEKVALYRVFLKKNGFANAPVTIDSLDWFITDRMEKRLRENPKADVSGYRDYYIQLVRDVALQKHELALKLGYNDLPHTLLVHHNVLNGLFLEDVMDALVADGWSFVDAKAALAHPLYKLEPKTPNRGRSVLSVLAIEQGIKPGFPEKYYGFGRDYMESLGL